MFFLVTYGVCGLIYLNFWKLFGFCCMSLSVCFKENRPLSFNLTSEIRKKHVNCRPNGFDYVPEISEGESRGFKIILQSHHHSMILHLAEYAYF